MKNKKTFKILAIFVGILIYILIANTASAETAWQYKVTLGGVPSTRDNFKTLEDCEADQKVYKLTGVGVNATLSKCESYTLSSSFDDPILINNKKNQDKQVSITPIKEFENKSTYNFLAPIGKLSRMDSSCAENDDTCISNNIGKYLNFIFKFIIGLCAALAVIMLIINGINYMGDESIFGKTEAKSKMLSAIGGLLIALGAYALLNTINPDLTGTKFSVSAAIVKISSEDTSNGSSTSLCISKTNPPNPNLATGTNVSLNPSMQTYLAEINKISSVSTGKKLLATAQANFEGFYPGTKSYRTNNPGNIGNTDDGSTKTFNSLTEGIQAQLNKVVSGKGSYVIGGKYPCALGDETYDGSLYQYLRIYATGARTSNNYLNAVIGYFKQNGKTITAKTKMADIYNMN